MSLVIASNAALRVAGGASSVLVGVYVADMARRGHDVGAALVGGLAALSFGAELVGALPLGVLADAIPPRFVMTGGALLAALGTFLFGLTRQVSVFVISRTLEGLAAAAVVPALLAYLTDEIAADDARRARATSYFEISLLVGLALGGVLGSQLWRIFGPRAFAALALLYVAAAVMMFVGATGGRGRQAHEVWQGLIGSLAAPALRRLAPVWLCMNAIIGLWLGPTLYFLLTHRSEGGQLLPGLFADDPGRLGWLLLGYSVVFGAGLLAWSRALPRVGLARTLWTSLTAMLIVSTGLLLLNHLRAAPLGLRWTLTAVIAVLIMVESGFTPAALSLLAIAAGPGAGRGAAMGLYSLLLSLGALAGSLLAGFAGQRLAIDGLIYATLTLAIVALLLLRRLNPAHFTASEVA